MGDNIIILYSGDVHLAAIGRFYSNAKLDMPKDKDYRYMPNVISSAIADMPETEMISDMLNKRNRVHHMDTNTEEDIIPIFTHDVDGKPRNNKRLLPRRNWCSIRAYQPGKYIHTIIVGTASRDVFLTRQIARFYSTSDARVSIGIPRGTSSSEATEDSVIDTRRWSHGWSLATALTAWWPPTIKGVELGRWRCSWPSSDESGRAIPAPRDRR